MTVLLLLSCVLSRCFLAPLGVLLVMKTLEDGWYVVINAYKLTFFEIWRDFNVLSYIACPCYPYIRVYRLYEMDKVCSNSCTSVADNIHSLKERVVQVIVTW